MHPVKEQKILSFHRQKEAVLQMIREIRPTESRDSVEVKIRSAQNVIDECNKGLDRLLGLGE